MVKLAAASAMALVLSGCVINTNSTRNPTLPYHTDHAILEDRAADVEAGFAAATPRPVAADLRVEDLVGYYPDGYGLELTDGGAFRKIRTAWLMPPADRAIRPEQRLTGAARTLLPGLGGRPVLLTGALVELAVYKVGAYNVADWRYDTVPSGEFRQRTIVQNGRTFLASVSISF